eukprot:2782933-Prymnesium_polylepis.1
MSEKSTEVFEAVPPRSMVSANLSIELPITHAASQQSAIQSVSRPCILGRVAAVRRLMTADR